MPTLYCRHIKTNGRRCLSPAMRGRALCYFHNKANAQHRLLTAPPAQPPELELILHPMTADPGEAQREPMAAIVAGRAGLSPANATLALPALEDRESIQMALSLSLQALAQNRIDPKRAYTLLFGLQVASRNAEELDLAASDQVVVDLTEDEAGEELAPDEDPMEIVEEEERQARLQEILDEPDEDDEDDDEDEDDDDDDEDDDEDEDEDWEEDED